MARNTRRGSGERRTTNKTSVLGSTLGDAQSRLRARGVPQSGIPAGDSLKIAEGALPDSTIGPVDARKAGHSILRIVAIVSGSLAALLLLFALVLAILSHTSVFRITSIETNDSEHVTAEDVARLVTINEGTTLLNVDTEAVEESVLNNPWVGSVEIQSQFPDKLVIRTTERKVGALVAMSSGSVCWLLGDDGHWIEPVHIATVEGQSFEDTVLTEAARLGVVMISNVPGTVSPVAGAASNDDAITAALTYHQLFSDAFKKGIVSYAAPSVDGVSCILQSGVEVSLGSPANVAAKEEVAEKILEQFAGQVTYINVRVPSRPTYRRVESEYVREGTGATGVSVDQENDFASLPQRPPEEEEDEEDGGLDSYDTSEDYDGNGTTSGSANARGTAGGTAGNATSTYGNDSDEGYYGV